MVDDPTATVIAMLDCVVTRDFDGATAHYAEDARYHVRAWQEPVVGHDAIRAEFDRQAGHFDSFRYDVVNLHSVGSTVFIERVDHLAMFGKDVDVHWFGVHEVDAEGLIAVTRDYYDGGEMAAQLA